MNINFDNQRVLVTGGSRGIGRAIAETFLDSGDCQVVITGQTTDEPFWVGSERDKGRHLSYLKLDFLSNDWVEDFRVFLNGSEGFDVCINNAGINSIHLLPDFPVKEIDKILQVNLQAPIVLSGMVARAMMQKRYGRIVNISSIFGVVTRSKRSAYTASKSGLIGVTKTMALDLSPYGILVNSISPGFIETELTRRVLGVDGIEEMKSKIPAGRLGSPEEIATYVVFLASKNNSYMTGENIAIDGGFLCE